MNCPKCKKKNKSDDDFCAKCGYRLKKEVKKITIRSIIAWIFGTLFILAGASSFSDSFFGSFLIILGGLIILPPIGNMLRDKYHIELSGWLKFIAFLILIGIGISLTQSAEKESIKIQPTERVKEEISSGQTPSETIESKQDFKTEDVITETKEKIYTMDENVKVDYLTYKIIQAQTFTEMGTSMFNKETQGKFIKVYLDIINDAKETKQIFSPRFWIEDNQGRKYERLSDDMMYIADYIELGVSLQPGLKISGAIVFELPKDSTNLKLIVKGDWLSISQIKVSLSNIQNIGKDTTQKEEQDKMMDEIMEDTEAQVEDLMNQCNSPFICASRDACPEYSDMGRKDCPSGYVCCLF